MITGFAEKAARDVQVVRRLAQYLIEIGPGGAITCQHNPIGPLSVIAVVGPVEKALVEGVAPTEGLLLEVGLGHAAPYKRSMRFIRHRGLLPSSAGFDIRFRHKYFALSKAQYLSVAPCLLRLMQEITDNHVRARRSGNMEDPFIIFASNLRVRRHAGEVVHWEIWQRLVRGIRFDIDARDEYLVADLCKITLYSQWLAHEVSGLHGFVTRCLERYSPGSSYERLMRNKYSAAAVQALRRPSLTDYTVFELLKKMRKHRLVEFLAYVTNCYHEPTLVHVCAQKALPKLKQRMLLPVQVGDVSLSVARMNARVHSLNGRLNVEVVPSGAAKNLAPDSDQLYDPNQIEIDEFMLEISSNEYDFGCDEPLF